MIHRIPFRLVHHLRKLTKPKLIKKAGSIKKFTVFSTPTVLTAAFWPLNIITDPIKDIEPIMSNDLEPFTPFKDKEFHDLCKALEFMFRKKDDEGFSLEPYVEQLKKELEGEAPMGTFLEQLKKGIEDNFSDNDLALLKKFVAGTVDKNVMNEVSHLSLKNHKRFKTKSYNKFNSFFLI